VRNRDNHLTTGFVGTPDLCHTLSRYDYLDVAYDLLLQDTYPSWLYPVKKGATTVWERWDGIKPDSTFQDAGMNSFNHYAYGAIGDWMYRVVAGIEIDPERPGYKHVLIQPRPGGGLSSVRASLNSMYGAVGSHWEFVDDRFSLRVRIPPNTRATIRLPGAVLEEVFESGRPVGSVEGINSAVQVDDAVLVESGSGNYVFTYGAEKLKTGEFE
jgi:alpha-L-rhamnosidase